MTRYLGGLITADETQSLPSNNFEDTSAPGIWTLSEAEMLNKQGLWPTAGVANPSTQIENIFSTDTFFDSNNAADDAGRTITNGINLSGEGGLVWVKSRTSAQDHSLTDTVRGASVRLSTNTTGANATGSKYDRVDQFNSNGFRYPNGFAAAQDYVAWTFRKAPNFFDIVSWSGNATAGRQISHSLGSLPGMIIVKNLTVAGNGWYIYHRSTGKAKYLLFTTDGELSSTTEWNNTDPTTTHFTVGSGGGVNGNGSNYVAYLFGHDTSSDGMIQCGTYSGNGSTTGPTVNLGFEPQWVMVKQTNAIGQWWNIIDFIRGFTTFSGSQTLGANDDDAEYVNANLGSSTPILSPTPTGFQVRSAQAATNQGGGGTYIYVAIRRAPMATQTVASNVFEVSSSGSSSPPPRFNASFPVGMALHKIIDQTTNWNLFAREFATDMLEVDTTNSLNTSYPNDTFDFTNGYNDQTTVDVDDISWMWRKAKGYFDVRVYDGTGSVTTHAHNLGVVPDMIWIKLLDSTGGFTRGWVVTSLHLPNATATNDTTLYLNTNAAEVDEAIMNDTGPTSSVFSVSADAHVNNSTSRYVAFLFANLDGVSKIGTVSHTNGSATAVDCGFTTGTQFLLLKRTDSVGDWEIFDPESNLLNGNYKQVLNSTAAQTTQNTIDTGGSSPANGFQIASGATTGTYFYYAIAI